MPAGKSRATYPDLGIALIRLYIPVGQKMRPQVKRTRKFLGTQGAGMHRCGGCTRGWRRRWRQRRSLFLGLDAFREICCSSIWPHLQIGAAATAFFLILVRIFATGKRGWGAAVVTVSFNPSLLCMAVVVASAAAVVVVAVIRRGETR